MAVTTQTWITTVDKWLTEVESFNNAQLVANHFKGTDWVAESIAALCGNMRHESSLNPNIYEFGYGHSLTRGYGLVQWTPATKYIDWANANSLPWATGDSQLARIDYEVSNNIQWIPKAEIDYMTFAEFRTNAKGWTVQMLTEAFTWGYERPNRTAGEESMPGRQSFAVKCLSELDWEGTGGGGTDPLPRQGNNPITKTYQYEKEGTWEKMTYYRVKSGDNLSAIAKAHNSDINGIVRVRFEVIENKNNLGLDEILLVPASRVPAPTPASTPNVSTPTPARTYKVKSGDNLSTIAKRFNTNVSSLAFKNGLKNANLIKIDQILKI